MSKTPIPIIEELFAKLDIPKLPMPSVRPLPGHYQLLWAGENDKQVIMRIDDGVDAIIYSICQIHPGAETNYKRSNQEEMLVIARATLDWLYNEKGEIH